MTAPIGPERAHFGGVDGAICVTRGSKTTWYWECIHYKWRIGGKDFQNSKDRVHLSGNVTLRSGLISQLCDKAPEHVKEQFTKLEIKKRKEKIAKSLNRKRAVELLASSPQLATAGSAEKLQPKAKRSSQSTLPFTSRKLLNSEVDDVWTRVCFGLNLTPNQIGHELFREAIVATSKSKIG